MHQRQAIRQGVRAALLGQTDAALKVYETRTAPVPINRLPAIMVYSLKETVDTAPYHTDGTQYRRLELAVDVIARGEAADASADTITAQVEAALAGGNLGGAVDSVQLAETVFDFDAVGEDDVLAARMTWAIGYYVIRPTEEAEPTLPDDIRASWVPDIGIPHEPDYFSIAEPPEDG